MMKYIFYILLFMLTMASYAHADTNIINVYDANGNLVTGDGNYYEYNDANQLVKVRQGDLNGAVIAEYFYDYSGQRIKKIENGVTTYYVSPHLEKQVGGAEPGDSKYYFAEGERVAKKDPAGNVYYYHSDHLGGVNAVTDSAGTVVAKADYMPFGDVKQGGTGNEKYSYTGKEKDKTDMYYFESRYNSPMFRHFTQADTIDPDISDPQDLNRYSYVGNNPLSYVDPDGHKKKKKAKLSKRERRAVALGLDPDKYKKMVGKMSKREFKAAVEAKHNAENRRARYALNYSGNLSPTINNGFTSNSNVASQVDNSSYEISREDYLDGLQTAGLELGKYGLMKGAQWAFKKGAINAFGRIGYLYSPLVNNAMGFAGAGVNAYMDTYKHPERDNINAMARFSIDATLVAISGIATIVAPNAGIAMGAAIAINRENIQEAVMHNPVTDAIGSALYKLGCY